MPTLPPTALLATAALAARRAGLHALAHRERRREANLIARHDVKLQLDLECQAVATDLILSAYPDHRILGEEDPVEKESPPAPAQDGTTPSPYEWIIDPIDGTVNFFHGNPYWCCSVAVRHAGFMQAGCVFAPALNLVFEGALGQPSRGNGEPLRVSDTAELRMANVHTGADKNAAPDSAPFRFFHRIATLVQRPRIYGAAALDICLVASGAADAFFEPGLYLWDIAAADLILRQAGGAGSRLREWSGHRLAYLGSNGRIHDALRSALEPLFETTPN